VGSTAERFLFGFRIFRPEYARVCCKLFHAHKLFRTCRHIGTLQIQIHFGHCSLQIEILRLTSRRAVFIWFLALPHFGKSSRIRRGFLNRLGLNVTFLLRFIFSHKIIQDQYFENIIGLISLSLLEKPLIFIFLMVLSTIYKYDLYTCVLKSELGELFIRL